MADQLVSDRGGDPVEISLDAGDHTVTFIHRESGTELDRVELIRQ